MKLLLMCYECSPYIGSEWAVGWGRLLGAAKIAETHVVTSEANFRDLTRARAEGLLPRNVQFHTPEPDQTLRTLERKPGVFAYNYEAYKHWQKLAMAYVKKLHITEHFDLVHQVNVCTFREPGYTFDLGIPYLWGPVGGSQNFPVPFLTALPPKEALKEGLRGIANQLTLHHPRVRRAARRAAYVIGANSVNRRDFYRAFGRDVELLLETGLHAVEQPDRSRFTARVSDKLAGHAPRPLRLLWSGEHHTRKALPVLLRALVRLQATTAWQLDVLGRGPMTTAWAREVERLGLKEKVRFLGQQAFPDAVAEMHKADVLCFTSLRDTSGNVVLEALAAGVPVLCFDHQGVGDMVDSSCGVKIAVTFPKRAYKDWADAIEALAADPDRLFALSHGATERAEKFLWEVNHKRVNQLYSELVYGPVERASENDPLAAREVASATEVHAS